MADDNGLTLTQRIMRLWRAPYFMNTNQIAKAVNRSEPFVDRVVAGVLAKQWECNHGA